MSLFATNYKTATDEIYAILTNAWTDSVNGAQPILEALLGSGNGYLPTLRIPGDIVTTDRDVRKIEARCGYVAGPDGQSAFRNGDLNKKYTATGRLAVQLFCPKNVAKAYEGGKLLAILVQSSFQTPPPGGSVWYKDQRILEVGSIQNDNQINVLVTATYEYRQKAELLVPVSTDSNTVTLTAAETISAFLAVATASSDHVEKATSADISKPAIGINTAGVTSGGQAIVQYGGQIVFNGWNWTMGLPIFVGIDGVLTQASPDTGYQQTVGYPVSSTSFIIELEDAINFG